MVEAEDTTQGKVGRQRFDMAVLATGMVPAAPQWLSGRPGTQANGFMVSDLEGIYPAGCVKRPMNVASSIRDATGAVLKSIHATRRRRANGK